MCDPSGARMFRCHPTDLPPVVPHAPWGASGPKITQGAPAGQCSCPSVHVRPPVGDVAAMKVAD